MSEPARTRARRSWRRSLASVVGLALALAIAPPGPREGSARAGETGVDPNYEALEGLIRSFQTDNPLIKPAVRDLEPRPPVDAFTGQEVTDNFWPEGMPVFEVHLHVRILGRDLTRLLRTALDCGLPSVGCSPPDFRDLRGRPDDPLHLEIYGFGAAGDITAPFDGDREFAFAFDTDAPQEFRQSVPADAFHLADCAVVQRGPPGDADVFTLTYDPQTGSFVDARGPVRVAQHPMGILFVLGEGHPCFGADGYRSMSFAADMREYRPGYVASYLNPDPNASTPLAPTGEFFEIDLTAPLETPAPEESPTPAESPSPAETPAEVEAAQPAAGVGGGFPFGILIWVGSGLLGGGLALGVWRRLKRPCAEEYRRWQAAKRACDRARAEQKAAEKGKQEAEEARKKAEKERDELCRRFPPACSPESWIEDEQTGRRVTSTDLWIERVWVREAWGRYQDAPSPESAAETERDWEEGPPPEFRDRMRKDAERARARKERLDKEVEDAAARAREAEGRARRAKERVEKACAEAEAARRAYEECMGKAAAAAAAAAGKEAPSEPAPVGAGAATATAPRPGGLATRPRTPREGDPCKDGETRAPTVLATFGPKDVTADYSLTVKPVGIRKTEEAEELSLRLGRLAVQIDAIGKALSGVRAAVAAGSGQLGRAAVGTGATVVDVPVNLADLATEVLEQVARLGSTVAGAVGRWTARHELYRVHAVEFVVKMDMAWKEVWVCRNGVWTCERVLDGEKGKLRKRRTIDREVTHQELAREVRRWSAALAGWVRSSMQEVKEFAERYRAGACS